MVNVNMRMIDVVENLILGKTLSEAHIELNKLKLSARVLVDYFNPIPEDRERIVIDDFTIRVCVENGTNYIITADYVRNRVNVTLKNSIISQVMTIG
jgi:hypothetical protein